MYTETLNTPIGTLLIQASAPGITHVGFFDSEIPAVRPNALTTACREQLQAYFDGRRKTFDLPLDQQGTAFQKSVWNSLLKIPFGQAVSYRDIADRVNNRKAVRAVGAANGKNPIAIIVPCHRVIGADRKLTGYAGGLQRKAWLLEHEGIAFNAGCENHQSDLFDQ